MRSNDWLNCWKKEKLICPYCYTEMEIEDYLNLLNNEEETHKFTCLCCDKELTSEIQYLFTATRIDKNGEQEEFWDDDEEVEDE